MDLPRAFLLFAQEEKQRGHEDSADGSQGKKRQDQQPDLIGTLCLLYGRFHFVQPLSFQEGFDLPIGLNVIAFIQPADTKKEQKCADVAGTVQNVRNHAVPEQAKYKGPQCSDGGQLQLFGFSAINFDVFFFDLFLHFFYVSFYQFVQRDMEHFAEPQQAVDVGIGLAGFP